MRVDNTGFGASGIPSPAQRRAETPEEAARQFEEILAKQFVKTMTDGLFKTSLAGDDAPGWMGAYGDMQKEALGDELAKHLVDSGTLRISEMLLRQWNRTSAAPDDEAGLPPSDPIDLVLPAPPHQLTDLPHLHALPPASGQGLLDLPHFHTTPPATELNSDAKPSEPKESPRQ